MKQSPDEQNISYYFHKNHIYSLYLIIFVAIYVIINEQLHTFTYFHLFNINFRRPFSIKEIRYSTKTIKKRNKKHLIKNKNKLIKTNLQKPVSRYRISADFLPLHGKYRPRNHIRPLKNKLQTYEIQF